jgi:DNA replication protein DnaC
VETALTSARIHEQLLELKMRHAEKSVDSLCEDAAQRQTGYSEFLSRLLDVELACRKDRGTQMLIRLSHLPFQKTLDQFDFSFQPSLDPRQVEELSTLRFITEARNVILLGPPGVGKTHLAVAIGLKACLAGYHVYCTSGHELGRRLVASLADDTLEKEFRELSRCRLLIIDEFGYLPYERQQATLIFQLIARRYERLATIVTTNKSFAQWSEVFGGDQAIASAILDRLLHHATVFNIRGPSYRLKDHQQALGLSAEDPSQPRPRKGGALPR